MESTYNDRETYAGHSRMNSSPARFETEFDSDGYIVTLSHNGCKLTSRLQDNARSRTIRDISGTLAATVDLRDIELRSIHLQRLTKDRNSLRRRREGQRVRHCNAHGSHTRQQAGYPIPHVQRLGIQDTRNFSKRRFQRKPNVGAVR